MVPDVFYSVCYGSKDVPKAIAQLHSFHPALLHGYCRRRVRYADYPGIIEDEGHQVFGSFTTGLTSANMDKLDYFEGSQYVRKRVSVKLLNKVGGENGEGNVEGEERTAEVYVFLDRNDLEDQEWCATLRPPFAGKCATKLTPRCRDLEHFRREKLARWTRAGYVFGGRCRCLSLDCPGSC